MEMATHRHGHGDTDKQPTANLVLHHSSPLGRVCSTCKILATVQIKELKWDSPKSTTRHEWSVEHQEEWNPRTRTEIKLQKRLRENPETWKTNTRCEVSNRRTNESRQWLPRLWARQGLTLITWIRKKRIDRCRLVLRTWKRGKWDKRCKVGPGRALSTRTLDSDSGSGSGFRKRGRTPSFSYIDDCVKT